MRYIILCFILLSSAALADTPAPADDKQKGQNDHAHQATLSEGAHHNTSTVQGNILPNTSHIAVAPSEFLSAPQYQPQPLPQNGTPVLYSLYPH